MSRVNAIVNQDIDLTGKCNGRHANCVLFVDKYKNPKTNPELTLDKFNKYLNYLNLSGNYNSCVSSYQNGNSNKIVKFISECCTRFPINPQNLGTIIHQLSDTELLNIYKFQFGNDDRYIEKIITADVPNNGYGQATFISIILSNYSTKRESAKYIFNSVPVRNFSQIINRCKQNITSNNESLFADYIKSNSPFMDSNICQNLITNLPYRSAIMNELFKVVVGGPIDKKVKLEILNKAIDNIDKNLIMQIFESCKDITPDIQMIDSLTKRVYPNASSLGASNSRLIAEIMDIFIIYGIKVDKELVIKLLNKTCYINNIEKYDVVIDEEILQICSNYSYYPYKFNIKPPKSVLLKECSKTNNLETLKKLKESGGEYDVDCLIEACKNKNNGKSIKYLINDCGVKANDSCVKVFQECYHVEALDLVIKGYDPSKKEETKISKSVLLDQDSTLIIEPRELCIDYNADYQLKSKIKKFLDYKKKSIKYLELYELMLKYLIAKKLVIGNYFVLNQNLADIIKLENANILHIDQLKHILTYFIDPVE